MGLKKKTGKARRDKFYHLAKETGYRSRAAFKLIQLNRKFGFLEKSRVCLDLCAAPGGWSQVAANSMPVSSLIIGIDLVPIKPIPKVTTLVGDITTEKCRQDVRKELRDWKVDVVLNDGAPNVGKNWLHDAFSQAGLTLHALKLAVGFLRKGGCFVTKVFRSQDYHALMWVFKQLFKKVHATKPQASRNESAEIFVICQGFLAPDKLDPKFLDPKSVFTDVQPEPENKINLFQPSKKSKKAEGYAEGDYTLHKKLPVTEFVTGEGDFLEKLAAASEIVFDDDTFLKHQATTKEIVECCKDIKVLGKRDIKNIIHWRKKVLATIQEPSKKAESVEIAAAESPDSDQDVEEEIKRLQAEELQEEKRKKKKTNKVKSKLRERMNLKMVIPGDKFDVTDDINLFDLKSIKTKSQLMTVGNSSQGDVVLEDEKDDGDGVNQLKHVSYDRTIDHVDAWDSGSEKDESDDGMGGNFHESDDDGSDIETTEYDAVENHSDDEGELVTKNPLLDDLGETEIQRKRQSSLWFKKDIFEDVIIEADEDYDMEQMMSEHRDKGGLIIDAEEKDSEGKKPKMNGNEVKDVSTNDTTVEQNKSMGDTDSSDDESSDSGSDSDNSDYEHMYDRKKYENGKAIETGEVEVVKTDTRPVPKLDAVGLALGAKMITSAKTKRALMDESYHRYAYHDDKLPSWFAEDEKRHTKRYMPVTFEEVQEYKDRLKAVNARPIKKIVEAKGRKKLRLIKKMEKARKKAEALEDQEGAGMSEKEKWQQIKSIYKKALNKKKPHVTYVVAKKGVGKRVSRPAGVKGRFKVVDPRMKKDVRGERQAADRKSKGKKSKGKDKKTKGKR